MRGDKKSVATPKHTDSVQESWTTQAMAILPPPKGKHVKKYDAETKFMVFTKAWSVFYVAVLACFVIMIVSTDILPANMLFGALAVIGLLSLLIFPILYYGNIKRTRKIVAVVLSVIMMTGYAFGMVNLNETAGFFSKVTSIGVETEDYYLIVREKSAYTKLANISGNKIGTYLSDERNYSKAKNNLAQKIDTEYVQVGNLSKLDDGLYDREYEGVFVGSGRYNAMCEKEKDFEKKTRILYTMRIDISSQATSKEVDVTKESFNVFISGLDTSGDITDTARSDVNMIVTINPKTHRILLTSIPRDYEIMLPTYDNAIDKLTHTGIYGVSETLGAVEGLMGLDINYYMKVNYTTVKKLINAIDGIDVENEEAFVTHGQKYFEFPAGKLHLNGAEAPAFARERKSFEDGDLQRNRNQEKVMEAIISKASSSRTILSKYSKILKSCEKYMEINMGAGKIRDLIKMQMAGGYKWTVDKQSLTGHSVTETVYSSGDYMLYVMQPDPQSVNKAVDNIIAIMDGADVEIKDEKATLDGRTDDGTGTGGEDGQMGDGTVTY